MDRRSLQQQRLPPLKQVPQQQHQQPLISCCQSQSVLLLPQDRQARAWADLAKFYPLSVRGLKESTGG